MQQKTSSESLSVKPTARHAGFGSRIYRAISMANYSHLTDQELLNHCEDRRHMSPILDELCKRLDAFVEGESKMVDANHQVECPACAAPLLVEPDPANNLFDLKYDKERNS